MAFCTIDKGGRQFSWPRCLWSNRWKYEIGDIPAWMFDLKFFVAVTKRPLKTEWCCLNNILLKLEPFLIEWGSVALGKFNQGHISARGWLRRERPSLNIEWTKRVGLYFVYKIFFRINVFQHWWNQFWGECLAVYCEWRLRHRSIKRFRNRRGFSFIDGCTSLWTRAWRTASWGTL